MMQFTKHSKIEDAPEKLGGARESVYAPLVETLAKMKPGQVLSVTLDAEDIATPEDHERKRCNIATAIRRGVFDYREEEDVSFRIEKTETGVRVLVRDLDDEE